jgi:hypothetical protein
MRAAIQVRRIWARVAARSIPCFPFKFVTFTKCPRHELRKRCKFRCGAVTKRRTLHASFSTSRGASSRGGRTAACHISLRLMITSDDHDDDDYMISVQRPTRSSRSFCSLVPARRSRPFNNRPLWGPMPPSLRICVAFCQPVMKCMNLHYSRPFCIVTLLHCPRLSQYDCSLPFPCIHAQTMQHCQHPHTASDFSNLTWAGQQSATLCLWCSCMK